MAKPSEAVLRRAAEWYAELRSNSDPAMATAFAQWRDADAAHGEAWRRVQAISRQFEPLRDADREVTLETLDQMRAARHGRRRVLAGIALAGGGLLGLGVWRRDELAESVLAATAGDRSAVGEITRLAAADGAIWLNTGSALDRDGGRFELRQGEVYVDTPSPLEIATRHGIVSLARGRCSVRRHPASSEIHLFSGNATVRSAHGVQDLEAGQGCQLSAAGVSRPQRADAAREAWIRGVVLAENLRLDALVAELARYQRGHIGVAGEIAHLRVLGGFPATDPQRALEMLEKALPVRVRRVLPWWTTVEARPL